MPLPSTASSHSTIPLALLLAVALLGGLAVAGWPIVQQVRVAPSSAPQTLVTPPGFGMRETRSARLATEAPGPRWSELDTPQKLALYPLAERWALMSEAQKRRWLALAQTFSHLPPEEQEKLHSRMTDWANLSAQQRSQARLNYAATKRLAPEDMRAQWEAYLALSDKERTQLAARAAPRPQGAATAVRPVSPKKLARVPAAIAAASSVRNPPKIPPQTDSHLPAISPHSAPQQNPIVETRPIADPAIVETIPIATPSAESTPLPPLSPHTDNDNSPNTDPATHQPNLYLQR
jgi:hypothetical protein